VNILYVENHSVFAENVKRQFLSQHLVTVVPSLAVARQTIQEKSFELLLVDYDLDDGKGDELVRELRVSGSPAIVIGVSSHADGNAALIKAGAATVCSKMEFDQIQMVIDSVTKCLHQSANKQ
jgi:DNA-binding response OmpR family regulator